MLGQLVHISGQHIVAIGTEPGRCLQQHMVRSLHGGGQKGRASMIAARCSNAGPVVIRYRLSEKQGQHNGHKGYDQGSGALLLQLVGLVGGGL